MEKDKYQCEDNIKYDGEEFDSVADYSYIIGPSHYDTDDDY